MTMHCAGRLGVLSWIYDQRHVIAFELGLSEERPIAECGTGYLNDGLVIIQQDDASYATPSVMFQAKEINLFFVFQIIDIDPGFSLVEKNYPVDFIDRYPPPVRGIFHPPSVA